MRDRVKVTNGPKPFPEANGAERLEPASPRQAHAVGSSPLPPANAANRHRGNGGLDSDSDGESIRGMGRKSGWPDSQGHAEQHPYGTPSVSALAASPPPSSALSAHADRAGRPQGGPSQRWEWPAWCLQANEPCIEVFVIDEDSGTHAWVQAAPQSRVVDKSGHDAYLSAEYEFDGEFYVQDFSPQNVRRRGEEMSVKDLVEKACGKSGDGDLDQTRRAPGRGGQGLMKARSDGFGDLDQTRLAPGHERRPRGLGE